MVTSLHTAIIFAIITVLFKTTSTQNCTCDKLTCEGHQQDSSEYAECIKANPLWNSNTECTFCSTCVDSSNGTNSIICTCISSDNCNTSSTSSSIESPTLWWTLSLSGGGILLCAFIVPMFLFCFKSYREDQQARLKESLEADLKHQRAFSRPAIKIQVEEHSEPNNTNDDKIEKRISMITPYDEEYVEEEVYFGIDIETICLVLGFTRSIRKFSMSKNKNVIHLIIGFFFDHNVEFNLFSVSNDYVFSSTPMYYGYHEWTVKVTKASIRRQEIGIIGKLDRDVKIGRSLTGEDMSICDIEKFGARCVYGSDCHKFYYAAYNSSGYERCKKDLSAFHKYERWIEGDEIRICLDLFAGNVAYYLNDKQIGKKVKVQKNKKYFPIISYFGRFRCELVHFQ